MLSAPVKRPQSTKWAVAQVVKARGKTKSDFLDNSARDAVDSYFEVAKSIKPRWLIAPSVHELFERFYDDPKPPYDLSPVWKESETLRKLIQNESLDQIEKIYIREQTTGDESIRKTQLGTYFERIHLAINKNEYHPYETKLEAYRALLSNLRPKKMLELRSNEDIQDALGLPREFDLKTKLSDPIYGVKVEDGKISNPYYETQLNLVHQLATTLKPVLEVSNKTPPKNYQILAQNDLDRLSELPSAVIIVPDLDHKIDRQAKDLVKEFIRRPDIDWVGLEMLPDNLQKFSDVYIFGNSNTEEWKEAEATLHRYFSQNWDKFWKENNQELAVFSILKEARKLKKRAVALDASHAYNNFTTEGADDYGPAVRLLRNYLWALRTPKTGRGVIFGGDGHFDEEIFSAVPFVGIRVQDFLKKLGHRNIFFKSHIQ